MTTRFNLVLDIFLELFTNLIQLTMIIRKCTIPNPFKFFVLKLISFKMAESGRGHLHSLLSFSTLPHLSSKFTHFDTSKFAIHKTKVYLMKICTHISLLLTSCMATESDHRVSSKANNDKV